MVKDDIVDKAIEKAEEDLANREVDTILEEVETETQTEPEVSPEPEASKTVEPEEPKISAKSQEKVSKRPYPSRKQITSDQKARSDDTEATEQDYSQDHSPIDALQFWSAEEKQAFAKAPREAQVAISKYEAQRNEWANRIATDTERGRSLERRMSEVYEPHKLKMQANGVRDPIEATSRLLAWNEIFEKDPKTGISELMRRNGLSPQDFYEVNGQQESQPYQDPRIDDALSQIEDQKRWIADQQRSVLNNQVESFKQGKDSTGQVRKPFAEMYAPQISHVAEVIQQEMPNISLDQALNQAYEYVLGESRKLFGVNGQSKTNGNGYAPKNNQQVIADAKKAQNAAGSISGAPNNAVTPTRSKLRGKSWDEKLNSAIDNAEESATI